jgi:hypothetical protein
LATPMFPAEAVDARAATAVKRELVKRMMVKWRVLMGCVVVRLRLFGSLLDSISTHGPQDAFYIPPGRRICLFLAPRIALT